MDYWKLWHMDLQWDHTIICRKSVDISSRDSLLNVVTYGNHVVNYFNIDSLYCKMQRHHRYRSSMWVRTEVSPIPWNIVFIRSWEKRVNACDFKLTKHYIKHVSPVKRVNQLYFGALNVEPSYCWTRICNAFYKQYGCYFPSVIHQ